MSARIFIRPRAQADLDDTAEYIGRENPATAVRFLAAAEETFKQLLATPGLGRVREYLDPRLTGLRSWRIRGFENWLVFYRPTDGGIDVVRVLHGARDLAPLLPDGQG